MTAIIRGTFDLKYFVFSFEQKSFVRSCLFAVPVAFFPSLTFVYVVNELLKLAVPGWQLPPDPNPNPSIFMAVILGPIIETLALTVGISLISQITVNKNRIALLSSLAWGGLHALAVPFWFVGTFWSFFVFSSMYLKWKEKSFWHGFACAAIVHSLVNLGAILSGRAGIKL